MTALRYRDWVCICALFFGVIFLLLIQQDAAERETAAYHQAELHHVQHGLLNPTKWIEIGGVILERKIDHFEFTESDQTQLNGLIENALTSLRQQLYQQMPVVAETAADLIRNLEYDSVCSDQDCVTAVPEWMERKVFNAAKPKVAALIEKYLPGAARKAMDAFLDEKSIKSLAAMITGLVVDYVSDPENRKRFKALMKTQLEDFKKSVASKADQTALKDALTTYECTERVPCQTVVKQHIESLDEHMRLKCLAIFVVVLLVFIVVLSDRKRFGPRHVSFLLAASTVLWLGGILTPMLEMQAKISRLDLSIAGETVSFTNEVLFYQSKSVLDFVWIMMSQGEFAMVVVGLLIGLFSIVFPLVKLVSTFVFAYDFKGLSKHSVVRFFAVYSGKWSMADVMVVAIFMAYIGFGRMIHTQFAQISASSEKVSLIDGGGTQFEVGFFLFLGFCMASLVASMTLNRMGSQTPETHLVED